MLVPLSQVSPVEWRRIWGTHPITSCTTKLAMFLPIACTVAFVARKARSAAVCSSLKASWCSWPDSSILRRSLAWNTWRTAIVCSADPAWQRCISPIDERRSGPAGLRGMHCMGLQSKGRWRAQMSNNCFLQRGEIAVSLVVSAVNSGESCCCRGIYSGGE